MSERGSVSLLIAAIAAIVVATLWVGAAATSVYIQHRHVLALADALADELAAAYDRPHYYDAGATSEIVTEESLQARLGQLLPTIPPAVMTQVPDTRVVAAYPEGRRRVVVTMQARATLPFVPDYLGPWRTGIPFAVSTHAELTFAPIR